MQFHLGTFLPLHEHSGKSYGWQGIKIPPHQKPPPLQLSLFRMIWPFAQRTPCVFTVLTSALGPGVSPVVLLTVCAGLPSEAIATLALPGELNGEVTAKNNSHGLKKIDNQFPHVSMSMSELCQRFCGSMRCVGYLVTGRGDGVVGVAAARLAARPPGQVPVVGGTVVTCQSHDIWQTLALAGGSLAHAVVAPHALTALRAQEVARALCGNHRQQLINL